MQDSNDTGVLASHLDPDRAETLQKRGTHEERNVSAVPHTEPLNTPHAFIPSHTLR